MVVWTVRHGETEWNRVGISQGHLPVPLNAQGRAQARAAARYLARHGPWDAIISSSLLRASQTAEIIQDAVQAPHCERTVDLAERYQGAGQGCTREERQAFFPDGEVPGMESTEALTERVWRAMDAMVERFLGQRVIVVGHGGSIRRFVVRAQGAEEPRGLPNCALHKLVHEDGSWRLLEARVTEHLA